MTWALVPEEWGRLQCTEKGRGHSKKGDSVSKAIRVRLAPEAGRSPERAGAYSQGSHHIHRLTSLLTHSRSREGLWQGTVLLPWDVRRTTCMKAPWAVGMERRAERATVAQDWKDSLGALDGERPPPFWGHSWFWVIRESMGHLGGRASVGKSEGSFIWGFITRFFWDVNN